MICENQQERQYINCFNILGKKGVHIIDIIRVSYREGNGTALQCSCLENPKGGGAS